MKVQWATASSRESSFPKQRPPLKGRAGPSLPIAGRRRFGRGTGKKWACLMFRQNFNFQRMIEKTDRIYPELLHSRGAE